MKIKGATFAYFSVTNTQNTATTVITGKAEKVGTVTVTGTQNTYALEVTAVDMAKPEDEDKTYYAIKSGDEGTQTDSTSGGKWKSTAQNLEAGTITLSGAETGDTVKCTVSVKVDLKGTMVSALSSEDVYFSLSGIDNFAGVSNIDLKTIADEGNTKTYTGTGTLDLTMAAATKKLTADVWLVNKKETDQSALAGKDLTVTLTLETADCKTEKTPTD